MDQNTESVLSRDDRNSVATLTLNRPKAYNSLSRQLMQELIKELKSVAEDKTIKVAVIRGSGRGFCAGHDLKEIHSETKREFYEAMMDECSRLMQAVTSIPQPVIAQVHGVATAAGCQLVASCDLAVAAEDARFATPGVLIGLFCSTPMVALSRNINRKQAMEMLLTGDMIDAKTAREYGLVNRVVAPQRLEEEARQLADKIAEKSSYTVALGKQAFYRQMEMGLADAYKHAKKVMVDNLMAHDSAEGIGAFLEKRTPAWKNC